MNTNTLARDNILGRLRAAPLATLPPPPDVKAWFDAQRRGEDMAQRVVRLRTAMEAVKTEFHDVTQTNWPDVLLGIAAAKCIGNLLIGSNTAHGATLQARPLGELQLVRYERPIEAWRDLLFDGIDASLTSARSAVAEIGSIILWPTPSEPRLMSLVPHIHFVLLDAATIHSDLHSAITAEGWSNGLPTNALLIGGPSKTADIQQTLAYGAHGPKELIVLLRHASGAAS
ncbi:MAG: lactate utilization protein [Comamonadaceae bacterium]